VLAPGALLDAECRFTIREDPNSLLIDSNIFGDGIKDCLLIRMYRSGRKEKKRQPEDCDPSIHGKLDLGTAAFEGRR
jgi:hypothetical protein